VQSWIGLVRAAMCHH